MPAVFMCHGPSHLWQTMPCKHPLQGCSSSCTTLCQVPSECNPDAGFMLTPSSKAHLSIPWTRAGLLSPPGSSWCLCTALPSLLQMLRILPAEGPKSGAMQRITIATATPKTRSTTLGNAISSFVKDNLKKNIPSQPWAGAPAGRRPSHPSPAAQNSEESDNLQ